MNVSSFDLNHIRALHFLLEEAHVAHAASRLGITAAAASNALRRLREELGDALLVRLGRRLVRTPLAEELRAPAREVLAAAERIVSARTRFDPATYDGPFEIITADRVASALLPSLDRLLSARAPRATLRLRLVPVDMATTLRDAATVALAVSFFDPLPKTLECEALFDDALVCVLRRGNPLLRGPWSVRRYAAAEHVLVTPRGASDLGIVDHALASRGLSRRVTRVVPTFALALPLLTDSDRIATLPVSFAEANASPLGLVLRPPPLTLDAVTMTMAWHARQSTDPRHLWLRAVVRDAVVAAKLRRR